jgi:4-hydroxy-3-polyprenylbenzoate decarboxylase
MRERKIAVAMTGGSGAVYGRRLVDALCEVGYEVHFMLSGPARRVLRYEDGIDLGDGRFELASLFARPDSVVYHAPDAVEAAPASGSAGIEAMVVCPCSMGTLGRIAHGYSLGLIERAADVSLKEGRKLVLVPRETPLSLIHLENMVTIARAGGVILPAAPGFYNKPRSIDDLVSFVVGKILLRLAIDAPGLPTWETPAEYEGEE